MNSSQWAFVASAVSVLLFALVLTSAQSRVLRRPAPRRVPYVVAWLACVVVFGAFRTLADHLVGRVGLEVALTNIAWTAAVSAVALVVAHRLGDLRFRRLFPVHLGVVALVTIAGMFMP